MQLKRALVGTGALVLAIAMMLVSSGLVAAAASCTTNNATSVKDTSAVLHGAIAGFTGSVSVGFQWATNSLFTGGHNVTVGTVTDAGSFVLTLTGLAMNTRYYFFAWAIKSGLYTGSIKSFTTTLYVSTTNDMTSMLVAFLPLVVILFVIGVTFSYLFGIFGEAGDKVRPSIKK